MANRRTTVVGAFSETAQAEQAIEALRGAGFSNDEIRYSEAMTGGSFFEHLKSWFTGEELPTKDDVAQYLKNVGLPENEASYYAREHAAGHPLVAVRAPGREEEATSILRSSGGFQMASGEGGEAFTRQQSPEYAQPADRSYDQGVIRPSAQGAGYEPPVPPPAGPGAPEPERSTGAQPAGPGTPGSDLGSSGEQAEAIRLREEQLRAEKQRVQKGEVRVHKDVVEEPQNIEVPVRHEEVVVERHPFGESRETDTAPGQDEIIRVPVSEEQVTVTRHPVETGEVDIKKKTVEEPRRVTDTTRREEARIEPTGDIPIEEPDDQERRR